MKAEHPAQRRWPASLAVAVALVSQLFLPEAASVGPSWLLPAAQAALLAPLIASNPLTLRVDHPALRFVAATSACSVMVVNATTLLHLVARLGAGTRLTSQELLVVVVVLLTTNVVAVAVIFWELDGGGPFARDPRHPRPADQRDLLFPQQTSVDTHGWLPGFTDYLFVAFTLTTAFSPTDTMPLRGRAKILFMLGSSVSMGTLAILAARAANLL